MSRGGRARGSAGQSTVLVLAILFVTAAIALAIVSLGAEGVQRGRLQAIADLTALAAAHGGAAGHAVAQRNGVDLVSVREGDDGSVVVTIERDGRRAIASATT